MRPALRARLERALGRLVAEPSVAWVSLEVAGKPVLQVEGPASPAVHERCLTPRPGFALRVGLGHGTVDEATVADAADWAADLLLPSDDGPPPSGADELPWAAVVAAQSEGIVLIRADGTIVFANPVAERVLGRRDVVGRNIRADMDSRVTEAGEPVGPESSPVLHTLRTGQPHHAVLGVPDATGRLLWLANHVAPLPGSPNLFLVSFTDISEYKRLRDEAQADGALQRSTLASLREGVVVLNERLQVVEANPAACATLGHTRESLTAADAQARPAMWRPDGSRLRVEEWPAWRALHHGVSVRGELLEYERPDGERRWLLMSAEPVTGRRRVVVSFADVTVLQTARAAAEGASTRWRALMDNLHEAVILFGADGRIEDANRAAAAILGLDLAALAEAPIPMPHVEVVHDGPAPAPTERPSERCRRTGQPVTGVIAGMVTPLGIRWYVNTAVPLPGGRVLLSLLDFTENREARAEAERRKDEFVCTLSHELRTPLTSLDGALALLEAGAAGPLAPDAASLVALARRSSARLVRLVSDVLDLERIAAGGASVRFGPHPVLPILQHAAQAAAPSAAQRGVRLTLHADADPRVRVDPDRLSQILANLLANAIQFSPEGAEVAVHAAEEGQLVKIEVRDQGPGVPEAFRPRLFTRFAQAQPGTARGGAGLGLSICRALATALDGEVGYRPAHAGGSVFWLAVRRENE